MPMRWGVPKKSAPRKICRPGIFIGIFVAIELKATNEGRTRIARVFQGGKLPVMMTPQTPRFRDNPQGWKNPPPGACRTNVAQNDDSSEVAGPPGPLSRSGSEETFPRPVLKNSWVFYCPYIYLYIYIYICIHTFTYISLRIHGTGIFFQHKTLPTPFLCRLLSAKCTIAIWWVLKQWCSSLTTSSNQYKTIATIRRIWCTKKQESSWAYLRVE